MARNKRRGHVRDEVAPKSHNSNIFIGRHYAMERFCIGCGVVLLALLLVTIFMIVSIHNKNQLVFEDTAIYNTSATGSVSGVTASVETLAEGHDRTRAALVIKFDDVFGVPAHTNGWQVHVTGVSPDRQSQRTILRNLGGAFVMYGTSGYAAICLESDRPFESELYYIALEAVQDVGSRDGNGNTSNMASGVDTDVFEFTVNLGANQAVPAESLDESFDMGNLIAETVVADELVREFDTLNEDEEKLFELSKTIDDGLSRLDDFGIETNGALPALVTKDTFEETEYGVVYTSGVDMDDAIEVDEEGVRGGGVESVDEVNGTPLSEFVAAYKKGQTPKFSHEWLFVDGRSFAEVQLGNKTDRVEKIQDTISHVESAIEEYLSTKHTMQTDHTLAIVETIQEYSTITESIEHSDGIDVY